MVSYNNSQKSRILKEYDSSLSGLTTSEVKRRIKKYGLNELPKEEQKGFFKSFLSALNDPIIYVLIVCAILSFIVGESVDGLAIIVIILIDAIMSGIQEHKAQMNSEALKDLIKVKVKVIRNNRHIEVDSEQIVPGDIIVVESGTLICADSRIITSNNLTVNESVLTGESVGVAKNFEKLKFSSTKSILYAGTSVLTGRALAVVTTTGINTEVGKIAKKVTDTKEAKSPLTMRMEKFSKQITLIIIFISLIIGYVLYSKGYKAMDIFLSVVALSVSAMPEGLPLALTMALTIGSNKMSKRNVIVKKLNSVESLGSCTVIASDKTGTLTVNEQTAKKILLANGEEFDVEGNGYNDEGSVVPLNKSSIKNAKYISLLASINNDAIFEKSKGVWDCFGDSIDVAFLALSRKLEIDISEYKRDFEIPYESEKKYSAVFYKKGNKTYCTAKGSLEVILDFCRKSYDNGKLVKLNKEKIIKQNDELAALGYRVIAVCDGEVSSLEKYSEKNVANLNFVGLVGFIDPIRKEAKSSIKECYNAGIKVLMITGDHALTAYTIAKDLEMIETKEEVATGSDLDFYIENNEKFDEFIKDKKVFARVTPLQKLKIVESLQRQGEFVAVTGDGVNDAPAIKAANIGVAMGSGTDVAKEAAKMIIIDDNFASIVAGIEEGRNAYSNIRKICIMLLSCGLAEVLFFVLAIARNLPIPLVAIQLLWLNLVTDGLQDMALSFERETDTIMKEKPRSTKESIFEKELVKQILLSGLFIGAVVFVLWFILMRNHVEVKLARGYVLALMVFIQNIHVLNCRSERKSVLENSILNNKFILFTIVCSIGLQVLVMESNTLSKFLQTYPISYWHMLILLLLAFPILIVMELYKSFKKSKKMV